MKTKTLSLLLLCLSTATLAAEQYNCVRVITDGKGGQQQNPGEYVELSINDQAVEARIHLAAATKPLTFRTCKAVPADESNFSTWFATECRTMASADNSPVTFEPFLLGAYAGISPIIGNTYSLYAALQTAGKKSGAGMPERTFVIYGSDRKPMYEFFCRRR
ncbi:MAG: hypothetical protein ACM3SV_07815 [Betaproteobacteria bacterium]